jgi:hypothetical protein
MIFFVHKGRTRSTNATETSRIFAFNMSHALSACLTYTF